MDRDDLWPALVLLGLLTLGSGLFFAFHYWVRMRPPATETPPAPSRGPHRYSHPGPGQPVPSPEPDAPRVAIVIDDLGWSRSTASIYDRIDAPLTMALLPGRPHSRWFYERWKDRFEFLLHMPMEPMGYPDDDPGRLALMRSMNEREVQQRIDRVLKEYPKVVGMNNHMGSSFTQDRRGMKSVMEILARKKLIYLDSATSRRSVALEVADRWRVPAVRNQFFLDRRRQPRYIEGQLKRLVQRARKNGWSIGIGHIQSEATARVLAREIPRYQQQGVEFVPLSRIIRRARSGTK